MRIVILGGNSIYTNMLYNALSCEYSIEKIIVERSVKKNQLIKRRIKKLGFVIVMGQVMFKAICVPILKKKAETRIEEIINMYDLNISNDYTKTEKYVLIDSVNSNKCIDLLKEIDPDIVIVNGTRIINEKVLNSIEAKFVNMHMGITPKYRGVHGAYWALYEGDKEHAGVTIHYIDEGIDTGEIIGQEIIPVNEKDNFITYPYLQMAYGIQLEKRILKNIDKYKVKRNELPSVLRTHPTIAQYLFGYFKKNVK